MAKVRNKEVIKSQHYQKCQKANRPGQDFPAVSPGRVQGYADGVGGLAVREGRNEDKWSKVQPLCRREKSLCTFPPRESFRLNLRGAKVMLPFSQFYAPEAQKVELDQSLFRKSQV